MNESDIIILERWLRRECNLYFLETAISGLHEYPRIYRKSVLPAGKEIFVFINPNVVRLTDSTGKKRTCSYSDPQLISTIERLVTTGLL